MIVRASSNEFEAVVDQRFCESLRIFHDLLNVCFEFGFERFAERHRFCRDDVLERAALNSRKNFRVQRFCDFMIRSNAKIMPPRGPARQSFVCRRCNIIRVADRRGVNACRNEPGEVSHVDDESGADIIRDFSEQFEIKMTRISAITSDQQFWFMFSCLIQNQIVVDAARFRVEPVEYRLVKRSAKIDRRAMSEMPAVRKIHSQDGFAGRSRDQNVAIFAWEPECG